MAMSQSRPFPHKKTIDIFTTNLHIFLLRKPFLGENMIPNHKLMSEICRKENAPKHWPIYKQGNFRNWSYGRWLIWAYGSSNCPQLILNESVFHSFFGSRLCWIYLYFDWKNQNNSIILPGNRCVCFHERLCVFIAFVSAKSNLPLYIRNLFLLLFDLITFLFFLFHMCAEL